MSNEIRVFGTYLYLRESGTPYYVGKFSHLRRVTDGQHNVPIPKDRLRILVQEFPSHEDAVAAEMFLISYYGRKDLGTGCLRNRTDGGEGALGVVHSDETCQKIRTSLMGNTPWNKGKSGIGKPWSAARRARMEAKRTGPLPRSHRRRLNSTRRKYKRMAGSTPTHES
jgi:hypothetical protein